LCHPKETDCFAWAKFWAGGLTYYGGFIGASISAYYLLKRDRFPFWKAADMAGFAVPLGLAFGRMGCLLAGCCFGVTTDVPWALTFPGHSPASESQWKTHLLPSLASPSLPVHPTQIYESAASLAISAVCVLAIHPHKRYDGQVFASFVALYAAARFILEFWRDDDRGGFAHLSTSQLLGIAFVAAAIALHVVRSRGRRPVHAGVTDVL
jgi:phosphatidylglycerol:prolipoprotein diacylglycerol transferase